MRTSGLNCDVRNKIVFELFYSLGSLVMAANITLTTTCKKEAPALPLVKEERSLPQ